MPSTTSNTFSPELANALETNSRIKRLASALDLDNIKQDDKLILGQLDVAISTYLAADKDLLLQWKNQADQFYAALEWSSPTDQRVVAALLLAGAAIVMPGLNLRSDLSPSLVAARNAYQAGGLSAIDPGDRGGVVPRLKSSIGADSVSGAGEPIASILANTFVKLSPNAQGKLAKAFKELLENKDKPLRVGRDFHSLDLAKLHEVREARFSPQRIARVVRQSSGDNNARVRSAWAPTTTALNLINFECVRQQEDAKDEIFWVGYFYSVDNLKTVYDSLDAAIQNGALAEVCLNVEWKVQGFRSQLYGGIQPGQPIQILNGTLGTAAVYHGFGPWTARLICIEDDDREYEAVGEAIDKVSDCARAIGAFASTVAAISGPTPMGAASAAVASAASYVQLCCDITGAIVDIVNYFDNNDTIGFADFNGRGDYAEEKPRSSLSPASVTKTATAGNRSRGGCYDITSLETLGNVSEEFQRLWRFRQETANAKSVRRNPMGIWGGSGTDKIKIDLSAPADMLIDKGVDYDAKGNDFHAEWVGDPLLQANHVEGTVRWGVRAQHAIEYLPWVMAAMFTKPEEERFLTR